MTVLVLLHIITIPYISNIACYITNKPYSFVLEPILIFMAWGDKDTTKKDS